MTADLLHRYLSLTTRFLQLRHEVLSRRITFSNTTLIQALNGETAGGQFSCTLRSGQAILPDVEYDVVNDFLNCSTVNGGFRANSFSTTIGQSFLYTLSGYNGACTIFYGPLTSGVDSSDVLQSDPLSVGGRVFVRIGEPECELGISCTTIPVTPGVCDSTLDRASADVTFAPLPFSITDPDGIDNSIFAFSIMSGNEGDFFSIDSVTGAVTLVRALDRDLGQSNFTLIVQVTDGTFTNRFSVYLTVEDRNDNPPVPVQDPIRAQVDEGAAIPIEVPFSFTDPDEGANAQITYSLIGADGDFSIANSTVGLIVGQREFDYDAGDRLFTFTVVATDGGIPSLSGRATVEITINDVNDNLPSVVVEGIPDLAYVEDTSPVSPAVVLVMDSDSDRFPQLFAVVRIFNARNAKDEILSLNASLPSGFRMGYYNNTLMIVGAGDPNLYGSLLSAVTYENLAELFEIPLERTLVYGVCDQLMNNAVFTLVSSDTRLALTSTTASNALLPFEDFEVLIDACRELVEDNTSLSLEETNDRPSLLDVTIEFPSIREDQATEMSMGSCVSNLFSQAIIDVDRNPFVGIAVVGRGSPATPQSGLVGEDNFCRRTHNTFQPLGSEGCSSTSNTVCPCRQGHTLTCTVSDSGNEIGFVCVDAENLISACVCSLPPSTGRKKRQTLDPSNGVIILPDFSNIILAELYPGVGDPIDFTSLYTEGSFSAQLESYQQQCNILSSNGSYYSFTFRNGSTVEIDTPRINFVFSPITSVNESSALVLGPTSFIRWIPHENQVGTAYIYYKAWDGSNGVPSGTTGVDTNNEDDTSFSSEIGNATVDVLPVNDAPVIELGGPGQVNYTTTYVEGGPSVFVAHRNARVVEFDSTDLTLFDLRVRISAAGGSCDLPNYSGVSTDRLSYFNDTEIQLNYSMSQIGQACVQYTFTGELSVNQWSAFITTIRFRVEDDEPSDHTRQIMFIIQDLLLNSEPSYTLVDLQLVSDICPVITLPGTSPVVHAEHQGLTLLDGTILLSDGDRDPLISSVTVSILTTQNNPCDTCELSATTGSTGIAASFNSTSLVLTLSGSASPESYEQVLRTVSFEDTGSEPSFNLVDVRFSVFDPAVSPCPSAMADLGVMVEHLNDNSPELYLDFDLRQDYSTVFTEGGAPVRVTGAEVRIMDADGLESSSYSIVVEIEEGCMSAEDRLVFESGYTPSTVSIPYDISSCSLTLAGSRGVLESDLQRLRYNNLNVGDPSTSQRRLNFTITDGSLDSTFSETVLDVVAVNDPPVIDLNVQDALTSNSRVLFTLGTTSASIAPRGASIQDPDDTNLVGVSLVLSEVDTNGNEINPRSDAFFESIRSNNPNLLSSFSLVLTYDRNTGIANIAGTAPIANYVAVLNDLIYFNDRFPQTENRRIISIQANDGESVSAVVVATIMFSGELNRPELDLNANEPGLNVQETYVITTPPVTLFPNAYLTDMDGDHICTVNVTLSGPNTTCFASSLSFGSAFSDITVNISDTEGRATYLLYSSFADCREAIVFQAVIRGITFSLPESASAGMCEISVSAIDARNSPSNVATGTVEVRTFNAAPFIDLDLGLYGRDYSTIYFQGGRLQHLVSIFDPATARNITDMTVIGEADGEAPFDDGTIYHGVVIMEESNAGYTLTDVDSPILDYLQVNI